jgi:1,6-anhydro-N-acetylmuramate kinase
MSNFIILTDSGCDLPASLAEKMQLAVLPLTVYLEEDSYRNFLDNREIDPHDFYERLKTAKNVKTAAVNLVHNALQKGEEISTPDLAAAISHAVAEAIAPRVVACALEKGRKTVVAAGGVAANSTLRAALQNLCDKNGLKLCLPPLKLCGDNGSMIAAQAYYEFLAGNTSDSSQNCYATMPAEENVSAWTL